MVASSGNGKINILGCEIFVDPGGTIVNDGGLGITTITGRDVIAPQSITVAAGSSISTGGIGGVNSLVYLDALKPPVIDGTVTPAPLLVIDGFLSACPGCSDGVIDAGETCDDGNQIAGDGCSSDCQLESCIARSVDYPNQPLCNDGVGCTVDICNVVTGNCEHVINCDDGIVCTIDQCVGDQCVHTPDDSVCADANACTDDICSQGAGCFHDNNLAACDDGLFCNGSDSCKGGICSTHAGTPCGGWGCPAGAGPLALDSVFTILSTGMRSV